MADSDPKSWRKQKSSKTKQTEEKPNLVCKETKMQDMIDDLNKNMLPEHRIFWMTGVGWTTEKLWTYERLGWRIKKTIEGQTLLIDDKGNVRCSGMDKFDIILQLCLDAEGEKNGSASY